MNFTVKLILDALYSLLGNNYIVELLLASLALCFVSTTNYCINQEYKRKTEPNGCAYHSIRSNCAYFTGLIYFQTKM